MKRNPTDIADKLRERLEACGCKSGQFGGPCGGCQHDAMTLAEINRLRVEVANLRMEMRRLEDYHG